MKTGRKYILDMNTVTSCGLGTTVMNGIETSILASFTVNYTTGGTPITYSAITIDQLQELSVNDYIQRVSDFLTYLNINDPTIKENLINSAMYDEPNCNYFCYLNPDFTIYSFLSGVRIINIGNTNGTAQYKVYPLNTDPNLYSWQTSGTFLNLDPNGVYTAVIADIIGNDIICEYSKEFSMTLVQTTINASSPSLIPTISLNEIVSNVNGIDNYKSGLLSINPLLSNSDSMTVNYSTNTNIVGSGSANVTLWCKSNNSNTYNKIQSISDSNGPANRICNLQMFAGDSVCYELSSLVNMYGSCAESKFKILSVCNNNNNAIFDITRYKTQIFSKCEQQNNYVSLYLITGSTSGKTLSVRSGVIEFGSPIPEGQFINVGLSAMTTSFNGNSIVEFSCMPNGINEYVSLCKIDNTCLQPQYPILTATYGDQLCWEEKLFASCPGSISSNVMGINNLSASFGINPIIHPTRNCVSMSISQPSMPVTIDLCKNTNSYINNAICKKSTGYINVTPSLFDGQNVNINFNANLNVCDVNLTNIPKSSLNIYRKPIGGARFVSICKLYNSDFVQSGTIPIIFGDSICYNMNVTIGCGIQDCATATFQLNSVNGGGGISPLISNINYCDCLNL